MAQLQRKIAGREEEGEGGGVGGGEGGEEKEAFPGIPMRVLAGSEEEGVEWGEEGEEGERTSIGICEWGSSDKRLVESGVFIFILAFYFNF